MRIIQPRFKTEGSRAREGVEDLRKNKNSQVLERLTSTKSSPIPWKKILYQTGGAVDSGIRRLPNARRRRVNAICASSARRLHQACTRRRGQARLSQRNAASQARHCTKASFDSMLRQCSLARLNRSLFSPLVKETGIRMLIQSVERGSGVCKIE
jgi:hypothetical protein